MVAPEKKITMEEFKQFCTAELDGALNRGEVELRSWGATYETPTGLEITRFAGGMLVVECDTGELGPDDGQRQLKIDWATTPPHVTEETDTAGGVVAQSIFNCR